MCKVRSNTEALTSGGLKDPVKMKSTLKGKDAVSWKTATLESWSTSSGRLVLGLPNASALVLLPCNSYLPYAVVQSKANGKLQVFTKLRL